MKKLPEPTSLKDLQDQTLATKLGELLASGMSQAEICRQLDWSPKKLYRLCDQYPEIIRGIHADVQKKAALKGHRVIERFGEILDQSDNLNAAVKAGQALREAAGWTLKKHESGVTVNIFGENVNVNTLTGRQMEDLALAMAKDLGPETEKVINAEFAVRPAVGEGEGSVPEGQTGGAPEPSRGADEAEA